MAYQQLKIMSQQSAPFNKQRNTCDIVIPSYLTSSDLSQSSILVDMDVVSNSNVSQSATQTNDGVFDFRFASNFKPNVLVKNCKLVSESSGTLEERQANNVLQVNLQKLEQDFEDIDSSSWRSQGQGASQQEGIFVHQNKTGSTLSTTSNSIRIPLSHLFGLGSMTQYPNKKMGNTTIHLEFEDDVNKVAKMITPCSASSAKCSVTAPNLTHIVLSDTYTSSGGHPFYVGQRVQVDVEAQITSISEVVDGSGNITATLVVDTAQTATASGTVTSIESGSTVTYNIKEVNLLLYSIKLSQAQSQNMDNVLQQGANISFNTWTLERVNVLTIPKNTHYNRQFEIEPNVKNCLIMTPLPAKADPFLSRNDNINSYRFNLNTIDTTSRDVVPYGAIYNDRLMASCATSKINLNNNILFDRANSITDGTQVQESPLMLPQIVPLVSNYQTLQLQYLQNNLLAGNEKILYLFKNIQRQLKLTSSGVQMV